MGKIEYYQATLRLRSIRAEIEILKKMQINSIRERIQVLKETNDLLREQNKILVMRQSILITRGEVSHYLKTG